MPNRVVILAVTCTALAAVLGACAHPGSLTAQASAAPQARLQAMENAALARQQASVIPASGMLPIDDVVGLTVIQVSVAKDAGPQGAAVSADEGSELVVVSFKLTNVTPQRQTVPDWNKLLLVDPKGQTYKPDTGRTEKLAASCADCAKVGAPVDPAGGQATGHAVFQVPTGVFNPKTWVASWQEDESARIHLPEGQAASRKVTSSPAADLRAPSPAPSCQGAAPSTTCISV